MAERVVSASWIKLGLAGHRAEGAICGVGPELFIIVVGSARGRPRRLPSRRASA